MLFTSDPCCCYKIVNTIWFDGYSNNRTEIKFLAILGGKLIYFFNSNTIFQQLKSCFSDYFNS